ncbi:MAG: hypothetical protein K0A99_05510 [Desulfoarculaceae bacterium]|nr:hypothetical protein [Desulfoarculaceae bacterium]
MPQSPGYGKGDKMVYGPHRKSGMLRDTSIQPGQTRHETFEIKFPYEDTEKDGIKTREVKDKSMDVTVKLWHMPAGGDPTEAEEGQGKFLLNEQKKTVTVK